jgi:hypothetical protein
MGSVFGSTVARHRPASITWRALPTVGLSEIWVLGVLFVGAKLFGFLGIRLAVPAAVAKIFVIRGVQYYRTTVLFRHVPPAAVPEQNPAHHDGLADPSTVGSYLTR